MFRTVTLSIIRSFSPYTQQWYMSYRFADSLRASCQPTCMYCCVYSEKLLMMDRGTVRNMQSFIPKIKFEKLVHLVGCSITIHHDARQMHYHHSPTCFGPYCAIFRDNFFIFLCSKLLLHFTTTKDCNFIYSNLKTTFVSTRDLQC